MFDSFTRQFGFSFNFKAGFSCAFDARDVCEVFTPSDIESGFDPMRACHIFPDGRPIDIAAGITQLSDLGKRKSQGIVLMNELSHSVSNERNGRSEPHGKSRRRRISALTSDGPALEAIFTGIRQAICVNCTCVAWRPENAGRDKRRLVHSIYRYKLI